MTAKEQLVHLLRIQDLALAIREAQRTIDEAPARVAEIEMRFRDRNAEYVVVKERFDDLQRDQKERNLELERLEEARKKYMDDLMQVKNQREYAAMLKEIDTVKAQISEHEDAILKDMEGIESLKGELASKEEHITAERERVGEECAEVERDEHSARHRADELREQRDRLESKLPGSMPRVIHQLEATRQGIFLSKVENGTCQSCFVRVRPQVFQEIKAASKLHACSSCRRFLYYEPTLSAAEHGEAPANGIEAVNGGAV